MATCKRCGNINRGDGFCSDEHKKLDELLKKADEQVKAGWTFEDYEESDDE